MRCHSQPDVGVERPQRSAARLWSPTASTVDETAVVIDETIAATGARTAATAEISNVV